MNLQSNYIQHKELYAAQGCKKTGKDLEKVMAGAPIFVAEHPDEVEVLKVCVFLHPNLSICSGFVNSFLVHRMQLFEDQGLFRETWLRMCCRSLLQFVDKTSNILYIIVIL